MQGAGGEQIGLEVAAEGGSLRDAVEDLARDVGKIFCGYAITPTEPGASFEEMAAQYLRANHERVEEFHFSKMWTTLAQSVKLVGLLCPSKAKSIFGDQFSRGLAGPGDAKDKLDRLMSIRKRLASLPEDSIAFGFDAYRFRDDLQPMTYLLIFDQTISRVYGLPCTQD